MALTGLSYFTDGPTTPSSLDLHHQKMVQSPSPMDSTQQVDPPAAKFTAQPVAPQLSPSADPRRKDASLSRSCSQGQTPDEPRAASLQLLAGSRRPISPPRKASPPPPANLADLPGSSPIRTPALPPAKVPDSPRASPTRRLASPPSLPSSPAKKLKHSSHKCASPRHSTPQPKPAKRSHSSGHGQPSHPPTSTAPLRALENYDSQVDVPERVLINLRYLMGMTPRINLLYLGSLNQREDVIEAAFSIILRDQDARRLIPQGKVIRKYRGRKPHADRVWGRGLELPRDDPYNLWTLSRAARHIYSLRGIKDDNLVAADPDLADHWGYDLDHDCLPIIIPHPKPPPVPGDPRSSKPFAREWRAFKWMYAPTRPNYGWAHYVTLRTHDPETFAVVRELAKAESLRNVLMSVMACNDYREALRRIAYERKEAEREKEPRWKWQ